MDVVVIGAAGLLGQQVCTLAAADPSVSRVLAVDRSEMSPIPPRVDSRRVDVATADLKPLLEGAGTVVHLAEPASAADEPATIGAAALARRILDAAAATGVAHVVLLSSAVAYGAWGNNPIPLTEEAPLRPNPGVVFAGEKAEIERIALDWREEHPGTTVTLLRPTVTVAEGRRGWLAQALQRRALVVGDADPPAQFLDVGDLATAVDAARRLRLDGPRNVAPDGWISGETVRALAGGGPRIRLPERFAVRLARLGGRWGIEATPPELLPYTVHPWVVANDRLRAEGWEPRRSNEEAFVAAHRARPWATLSPQRRQELSLGAMGVAAAAVAVGAGLLIRRRLRRRST